MMNRILTIGAAALLLVGSLLAQDEDAQFNKKQAERLNKFAKRAYKKGFPRQAKLFWLKSIKLYDPDSAAARKGLGHIKVGSSWSPDSTASYPTTDTGSGSDGASLFRAYEKLKKDLASAHRGQAQKWDKAGRTDKSHYHFRMVLRWVKTDKAAQEALEHREVGGVTGTALEETLYNRSKMIERAVADEAAKTYDVKKVEGARQAFLDKAQVEYITVQSEHFVLHGDPSEEKTLLEALEWAERALRVAKVAFPWELKIDKWHSEWAFFVAKDTYKQILRANGSLVRKLEWTLENTSTSGLSSPDGGSLSVGATGSSKTMFDKVVREVASGCSLLRTDGLREGIGHTFVGMIFNNNRLFGVDLEEQEGTTASEEDREYTSPDFDVWKNLALEMAWKMTEGTPARELPFCETAKFTNQQRIKAWSFTDYMVRRDPQLLLDMDRLGLAMRAKNQLRPLDFAKNFAEKHDVTVAQLDKEWEDFWTEASPVIKAIRANTPPLKAMSKGVEKWLAAFNAARKLHRATPVTFSANLSTRCYDHATYLKSNKKERGIGPEHRQSVDLGGTHLGSMFAELAIVETKAKIGNAKKMFKQWLGIPGLRDSLISDFLLTVGMSIEGDVLVMNVVTGVGQPRSKNSGYRSYPAGHAKGIPATVAVSDIGPELVDLLKEHGHGDLKTIGYPLSLHFGKSIPGNRNTYACTVKGRDGKLDGVLVLDDGKVRNTTAPGMVTFYPFTPLPRGDVSVLWTWEGGNGPQRLQVNFATK